MAKAPTVAQRRRWSAIAELGCIVAGLTPCEGRLTIHHCGTGGGGRKNHDKVIGLCWGHHLGPQGIDGKRISKRQWQYEYYTETVLLEMTELNLKEIGYA